MSENQNDGWVRVGEPTLWKPKTPGEVIEGRYVGRRTRRGMWGDFEVISVRGNDGSVWEVSGVQLFKQISHAALREGEDIRVRFAEEHRVKGRKKPMRKFEIFIRNSTPQCPPSEP